MNKLGFDIYQGMKTQEGEDVIEILERKVRGKIGSVKVGMRWGGGDEGLKEKVALRRSERLMKRGVEIESGRGVGSENKQSAEKSRLTDDEKVGLVKEAKGSLIDTGDAFDSSSFGFMRGKGGDEPLLLVKGCASRAMQTSATAIKTETARIAMEKPQSGL